MQLKSLEDVFLLHGTDLYRYLLQLSGHSPTAEDLVQDTFLKAYEHLENYQGEKVRAWLFRVAFNSYIDWYRREKIHIPTDPGLMENLIRDTQISPEKSCLTREIRDRWFEEVRRLPELSRQVLLLRDYCDFTYQDIAIILDLSLTRVKVTLYRARKKIREVMENELQGM